MGFFVKPLIVIQYLADLTTTHLPNDELFIGDSATALALHIHDNEGETLKDFYKGVVLFYQRFVQKQLQKFDY